MKNFLMTSGSRHRLHVGRPKWIVVLVCMVSIITLTVYIYSPRSSAACNLFSSSGCAVEELPPISFRKLSDVETAAHVVIREILHTPPLWSKKPKVAFMFLTSGPLPFERLWDMFFDGHEDKFTVYVLTTSEQPVRVSRYFAGRNIKSSKVFLGKISMVDAQRKLLANALADPDNQHFILLSDSCVPIRNFDYVYNFLVSTNVSFLDSFEDPGPQGAGSYSEHMLPEVEMKDFRRGSEWFTLKRKHAILVTADYLYYTKFRLHCRPGMEGYRRCYSGEHYLPTLFKIFDPNGIASWSVTFVDWSELKWQPSLFWVPDVTLEIIKTISSIETSIHTTSDEKGTVLRSPCMWNGRKRPCFLFARGIYPENLDTLMYVFSNYTL